jgi:diguanylate cyclase (GGDEF)-like protein
MAAGERTPVSSNPPSLKSPRPVVDEPTPMVGFPVSGTSERRPCLIALAGPLIGEVFALANADGFLIGRDQSAQLRLMEEGVSRRHAELMVDKGRVRLLDLDSTNGTWVGGVRVKTHLLNDGDRIRLGQTTVLKFTYHDPVEESFQRQLFEAALRDALTRAFNRRYFLQRLAAEMAFADRHRAPLGLLILDVDHFKTVNDTWGHLAGDAALQRVAEVILAKIRLDDVLARYGGEEFAVIARDTSIDGCMRLAERLRSAIIETRFEHEGRPIELRVSVGVAALPHPDYKTVEALIGAADEALYRAKNSGRNRVSR